MNRLQALHDAGVSIWLDTLTRDLLDSGELPELIADCAVTGATSNPTIFAKAITTSELYADQLQALGDRSPEELFLAVALDDAGRAADLLRPTYEASGGRDGFVSFECTPDLAGDAPGTVRQALDLWSRLARPNVMIKVPATEAGTAAIEELTARGASTPRSTRCCPLAPVSAAGWRSPTPTAPTGAIARDVIDTMPLATLRAFVDHGQTTRTLGESSDAAERMLRDAEHAGIDLDAITARLEIEGVQAFCDSYRELLSCVAQVSHSMT